VRRRTEIDGGCGVDAFKGSKERGRFDFGVLFPKGSLWDLITSLHEQRSKKGNVPVIDRRMSKLIMHGLLTFPKIAFDSTMPLYGILSRRRSGQGFPRSEDPPQEISLAPSQKPPMDLGNTAEPPVCMAACQRMTWEKLASEVEE
jgi:hypothetical protein